MKDIKRFVEQLFKKQHLSEEDPEAIKKLIEMLNEKVEDLKETGMSEEDAIHKTIVEFGELNDFYDPLVRKEKRRYKRKKQVQHYKNDLLFAFISSMLIIGMLAFINLHYASTSGLWFIIPGLAILFWPLSLLYRFWNKKNE